VWKEVSVYVARRFALLFSGSCARGIRLHITVVESLLGEEGEDREFGFLGVARLLDGDPARALGEETDLDRGFIQHAA
jgi:hypothetical protein